MVIGGLLFSVLGLEFAGPGKGGGWPFSVIMVSLASIRERFES